MRFAALLTLLSALVAHALVFVCLFAGYNKSTLTNLDMFSINASQIANTNFDNTTGNGCNCVEFVDGQLTINGTSVVNGTLDVETVPMAVSEYYSVFTFNVCDGQYLPDHRDPDASAVLMGCRHLSVGHVFDFPGLVNRAIDDVANRLNETLSLDDLEWPDGITNAFDYVKSAGGAMIVFFFSGFVFLLPTVGFATFGVFKHNRCVTLSLIVLSLLALLSLMIAAGLATAIITTVVNGINSHGEDIGLSADQGNYFTSMLWSAVAFLFVSTLIGIVQICSGSSRGGSRKERQGGYGMLPQKSMSPPPMAPMPYQPMGPMPYQPMAPPAPYMPMSYPQPGGMWQSPWSSQSTLYGQGPGGWGGYW